MNKVIFDAVLRASARLSRSPAGFVVPPLMRGLGRVVHLARRLPGSALPADDAARAWQSAFPSRRVVPIVEAAPDVTTARILAPCPLAGTGDLRACERLMAYDRGLLAPMGARLTVVASQAAGHASCLVAIHRGGA